MERIINRLTAATTFTDIQMAMNIEDEIFSELENLDTEVLSQKKTILEQSEQLVQQGEQIAKPDQQLAQQDDMLREMVKLLIDSGNTPSEIAEKLHKDLSVILKFL